MKRFYVSWLLVLGFVSLGFSGKIRVPIDYSVDNSYPPYMLLVEKGKPAKGICYEFLQEVLKLTGDEIEFVMLSAQRAIAAINEGIVDLEVFSNPNWRKDYPTSIYSIPYIQSADYFAFKKGKEFPVKKIEDLYGKTLEVIRGYGYGALDEPLKDGRIKRSESATENMMLEKLRAGRCDVAIINGAVFQYKVKQLGFDDLVLGDMYDKPVPISFRMDKRNQAKMDQINKAIEKLLKDGTLTKIAAKYGVKM